ncbi:TPA: hypothetical protein RTG57_001789 [Campylobacter jejuni]|nr:hypothetical protein [Campylobacter jejuni]
MTAAFENNYVEVIIRDHAKFMVDSFIKICECNWSNNENCNKCLSMNNLKFQLDNNEYCYIFVRYKFNKKDDERNFRWNCNRYIKSIQEYIDNGLDSDIAFVKYQRKRRKN